MKRKVMALFLALTMLIGMAPAVFAADTGFTDVAADAWYAEAVKWAVDNNITGGIGNGKFGPDQTCTRGQVVTFLWAAAGKPVMENADNPFTDVSASDWYYNAVMWAVSNNITGGTSATTFSPAAPCTRAAVVTFLYAAEGKPAVENADNSFSDVTSKHWFYAPVMWAVANNITGGIGNGKFGPDNACTRGQIALFLYKASLIGGNDEPVVTPEPEASEAKEYYEANAELIEVVNVEKSKDVQTEADVKSDLAAMGFGEYPISYEYDMSGAYVNETEIQDGSADKHPMYQTYYVSKNNEAWVLYVINGEVFANPLSFNLESNLGVMLLVSATEEITSYDNASNRFYVTIPHDTAVIVEHVDKIDAATLDALTIDELCKRSGAVIAADDAVPADETEAMDYALALEEAVTEVAAVDMAGATKDDPFIVVSLGDSYSSGEGIEPYYGQGKSVGEKVKDENWIAHRSENSWPGRLVISGVTEKGKTLKDYRVEVGQTSDKAIQWYFAAVSGATTVDFLFEQEKPIYQNISTVGTGLTGVGGVPYIDIYPMPRQLDVFKSIQGEVDIVTMTIGGNDAMFGDVITTCVTNFEYLKFGEISNLEEFLQDLWNGVDKIIASIHTAYAFTEEAAGKQAKIIVAGYPKLLDEKGYPPVIVSAEAKMINEKVSAFNDKIEGLVKSCRRDGMNIYFVDVEDEFDKDGGHPAYSKNQWIEPITIPVKYQDINHREFASSCSMHPTSRGAQAYADCVNAAIERINESDGIKGVVVYEGKPVNSGSITFSKSGYAVTAHTYEKGAFFVDYVPAGTYDITVVADGHDMLTIEKAVTVTGDADVIDLGVIELKSKAPVETKELKVALTCSSDNPEAQTMQWISDELYKRTDGRYKLKIYHDSKLTQEPSVDAVMMGVADMAVVANSELEVYIPDFAILNTPYLFDSLEHLNKVLKSDALDGLYDTTKQFGFTVLSGYSLGFRDIYTREKMVKKPADLSGQKIRAMYSAENIDMVNAMGGGALAMGMSEAYNAMQAGVVDGMENTIFTYMDLKHYEVAPYYNQTNHQATSDFLLIGNDVLKGMNSGDAKILQEICEESVQVGYDKAAKVRKEYEDAAKKKGVTFTASDVSAFQKCCAALMYSMADQSKLTRSTFDAIRKLGNGTIEEPAATKVAVVCDENGAKDGMINESVIGAVRALEESGDYILKVYEPTSSKDYVNNVRNAAKAGNQIIICVSAALQNAMDQVAVEYPGTQFLMIEGGANGTDSPYGKNKDYLYFDIGQQGYLAGIVAGLMTETDMIGYIQGMVSYEMNRYGIGFITGVNSVNPDAVILQYNTNSFDDPALGAAAVKFFVSKDVDVVFSAAGNTGTGAIEECDRQGIYAIGLNYDQHYLAPGTVIASAVKRYDLLVKIYVCGERNANLNSNNNYRGGLDNGVITLATTGGYLNDSVLQKIEEAKREAPYIPGDRAECPGFVLQ